MFKLCNWDLEKFKLEKLSQYSFKNWAAEIAQWPVLALHAEGLGFSSWHPQEQRQSTPRCDPQPNKTSCATGGRKQGLRLWSCMGPAQGGPLHREWTFSGSPGADSEPLGAAVWLIMAWLKNQMDSECGHQVPASQYPTAGFLVSGENQGLEVCLWLLSQHTAWGSSCSSHSQDQRKT